MASLTVENYLKTIYQISGRQGGEPAATGQVATALSVSPGTVTSMLKTLADSGLATYTPYEGAKLTPSGAALALRILRRHRLIELFLTKTLELSWDEVHEEAENMEHAVSDLLVDRIDAYLGYPRVDPHGDPIPRADGSLEDEQQLTLADCEVGSQFRFARVIDQSPEFLRYLSEAGLPLGAVGRVTANRAEAGIVTVTIAGQDTTLGRAAAEKILVAAVEDGSGR
ncbi:MAG: metal-dependent transcriptional regulator [Planctomycetia bacterium]|nr:metal-dependent transcriptional regulator [Planctomycetia bacterium]